MASARSWTSIEDDRLRRVMRECQGLSWADVAAGAFPDGSRNVKDCVERWSQLGKPMHVKGPWAPEEDTQLKALVTEFSVGKWGDVSKRMGTRSGKQCRERWHNHLDPSIDKTPFTPAEDEIILRLFSAMGPKWAEIARQLRGRPDNAIKNHYNTSLSRVRSRRESVSSTATASTSRSSGSPGPSSAAAAAAAARRRPAGDIPTAASSPRFTPYTHTRPRSSTDVLLPPQHIGSGIKTGFTEPSSSVLTRSQSNSDLPIRRRSVRTSLQMTPARSLDPNMHLNLARLGTQHLHHGFLPSGAVTAPILQSSYSSPIMPTSDLFDTWSTPPATPETPASLMPHDYYFISPHARMLNSSLHGQPSPATALQTALDDLVLSPGSVSTAPTPASILSHFAPSGSLPPSPQSPISGRSCAPWADAPMMSGSAPASSLAMYDVGLTRRSHVGTTGSLMSAPFMTTKHTSESSESSYGGRSSGSLGNALPMTPPRSTPSSCSTSSHSLSSFPLDESKHASGTTIMTGPDLSLMLPYHSAAPPAPAHPGTQHFYTAHVLRSQTRDTPSPAKSDLTV